MELEDFKTIRDVFLDYYPDERIDIQPSSIVAEAFAKEAEGEVIPGTLEDQIMHSGILNIMIYYPELVITNDRNDSQYPIYGLYACFTFPGCIIKLGRTDYTVEELYTGYRHSHIGTHQQRFLSNFCTGNGDTPINKVRSTINLGRYKRPNAPDLATTVMSLILVWEESVRIESAAGGPYIYFKNATSLINDTPMTIPRVDLRNCLARYNKKMTDRVIDFLNYYCSLGLDTFYYDGKSWQLQASDTEFVKRVTRVAKAYIKTKSVASQIFSPVFEKDGLYYTSRLSPSNLDVTQGTKVYWVFKNHNPEINIVKSQESATPEFVVNLPLLSILYTFLVTLTNAIYAKSNKDNLLSRARKISLALVKSMRVQDTDSL